MSVMNDFHEGTHFNPKHHDVRAITLYDKLTGEPCVCTCLVVIEDCKGWDYRMPRDYVINQLWTNIITFGETTVEK